MPPGSRLVLMSLEGAVPVEVGRIVVPGTVTAVEARGDVLYVVSQDDDAAMAWISSIDRSDPAAPALVSEIELPYARVGRQRWRVIVAFAGDRFYVARPSGVLPETETSVTTRLQVVEASDPSGALTLRPDEVLLAGAVQRPQQIEAGGDNVRVVTSPIRDVLNSMPPRISVFTDDGEALIQTATLSIPLEDNEYFMRSLIAHDIAYIWVGNSAGTRIQVIKLAATPLALYGTIDLGTSLHYTTDLVSLEDRVLVQYRLSEVSGPTRLALYALSGAAPTLVDEHELTGTFNAFLSYSETLGYAFMSGNTSFDGCFPEATLAIVRVTADGLEALGNVDVYGYDRFFASIDGQLVFETGGRLGVADAGAPSDVAWTPLVYTTQGLAISGDDVARVSIGEWSPSFLLDVSTLEDAVTPPSETFTLDVGTTTTSCGRYMPYFWRTGDHAFVLHSAYAPISSDTITTLFSVDVSNASEPVLDGKLSYPNTRGNAGGLDYILGTTPDALVFRILMSANDNTSWRHIFEWLDVSDPQHVQLRTLELPQGNLQTGHAAAFTMLDGTMIATTRDDESGAIILERIDLERVAEPRMLDPITVHGHLIAFDAESQRALLRRVDDECPWGLWDIALVELDGAESCVLSAVSGRGRPPIANDKVLASLVPEDGTLRLGTWENGTLVLSEVPLPDAEYQQLTLAGHNVLAQGSSVRIYDARCPDVAPVVLSDVIVARDGTSQEPALLVRQGQALVPAPRPACE